MKIPINSYQSLPKPLYRESITFATIPTYTPTLGTLLQEELHSAIDLLKSIVSLPQRCVSASQDTLEYHNPSSVSSERLEYWDYDGSKGSAVSKNKSSKERSSSRVLNVRLNSTKSFLFASTGSKSGTLKSPIPAAEGSETKSHFPSQNDSNQLVGNNLIELPNARSSPDELNMKEPTPPDLVRNFECRRFNCKSRRRFQMIMEALERHAHDIDE
ncbi:hypothetical protein C7M61_004610 [Candidozyma pseudohaemuli]|uniref:Uncharacterized protein n=1 Tax=Candidozyma pseudohaemuli TaxID=418784 RepID=A0A2P7YHC2_9ASCO|nr:hypothetical protein C7M61_004610 [[Candida] pseudohaemulonii]PSK35365.1 hypothetical protein C7M61_004610 [[Candida] pseudohaemulonii]